MAFASDTGYGNLVYFPAAVEVSFFKGSRTAVAGKNPFYIQTLSESPAFCLQDDGNGFTDTRACQAAVT